MTEVTVPKISARDQLASNGYTATPVTVELADPGRSFTGTSSTMGKADGYQVPAPVTAPRLPGTYV